MAKKLFVPVILLSLFFSTSLFSMQPDGHESQEIERKGQKRERDEAFDSDSDEQVNSKPCGSEKKQEGFIRPITTTTTTSSDISSLTEKEKILLGLVYIRSIFSYILLDLAKNHHCSCNEFLKQKKAELKRDFILNEALHDMACEDDILEQALEGIVDLKKPALIPPVITCYYKHPCLADDNCKAKGILIYRDQSSDPESMCHIVSQKFGPTQVKKVSEELQKLSNITEENRDIIQDKVVIFECGHFVSDQAFEGIKKDETKCPFCKKDLKEVWYVTIPGQQIGANLLVPIALGLSKSVQQKHREPAEQGFFQNILNIFGQLEELQAEVSQSQGMVSAQGRRSLPAPSLQIGANGAADFIVMVTNTPSQGGAARWYNISLVHRDSRAVHYQAHLTDETLHPSSSCLIYPCGHIHFMNSGQGALLSLLGSSVDCTVCNRTATNNNILRAYLPGLWMRAHLQPGNSVPANDLFQLIGDRN